MVVVNFSFSVTEPHTASILRTILEKFQVENMQETVVEDEVEIHENLLAELNKRVENLDKVTLVNSEIVRKKARDICTK